MHLATLIANHEMGPTVHMWLEHGGYAALFGLLFACGLGLPLPEDIPLLFAGALIARGNMSLLPAAIAAWCGIIGGDCVLYTLGRKYGLEVRRIPLVGRHLPEARIQHVHNLFEKYGVGVVAVGRMFAGIRGVMCVVAGAIRFTFWKFLLTDGLAAVVSGGLFVYLGYIFSRNMKEIFHYVHQGKQWMTIGLLVVLVIAVIFYFARRNRRKTAAEGSPDVSLDGVANSGSPAK